VTILVTINQAPNGSSPPPGVPGQAREDLHLDQEVTLTATGGVGTYTWVLLDAPTSPDVQLDSASVIAPTTGATVNITPDYDGTYYGTVTDGTDTTEWSFYAGEPLGDVSLGEFFPRRVPAFREGMAHNVPDAIDVGGNCKGWSREWRRWFAAMVNLSVRVDAALAMELGTTTDPVNVSSAAAPTPGQTLTAIDATHAEWVTPGGGGASWHTLLDVDFTAESAQNFSADGNYTIDGVTWTKVGSAKQDPGAGQFWEIVAGSGLRATCGDDVLGFDTNVLNYPSMWPVLNLGTLTGLIDPPLRISVIMGATKSSLAGEIAFAIGIEARNATTRVRQMAQKEIGTATGGPWLNTYCRGSSGTADNTAYLADSNVLVLLCPTGLFSNSVYAMVATAVGNAFPANFGTDYSCVGKGQGPVSVVADTNVAATSVNNWRCPISTNRYVNCFVTRYRIEAFY
jgi:hypothetical protein